MGVFNDTDRLLKWRYKVKDVYLIIPNSDDSYVIPTERLTGLSIEENYEEYFFPLLKVTLVLDSDLYYDILKHKNDCQLYFRIDKYYNEEAEEPSLCKNCIDDVFDLILDENTEDMLRSLKEDENSSDYTSRVASTSEDGLEGKNNNGVDFYLFKSSVEGTKKNVNKVLTKANVADAVAYLASVANLKNVVMAQPDNTTIYDELLIPPLSVLKALSFIDTYYGLYKKGSIIWFGLDYTYIIPYSGYCKAYVNNEKKITNIIIPKSTNTDHVSSLGTLVKKNDKKSNYIVADYSTLNINNESISNDYINANDIQVVDSYDEDSSTSESSAKSKKTNFIKIFENKTENPFIKTMYTAQTKAKSDVITVRLRDYDIAAISPNKRFNVIFEDSNYIKKYSGVYIIAGATHTFVLEGENLALDTILVLRKE